MFQDNPLLQQLKAQIRENLPTVEGTVKGTDRGFGFLEVEKGESHFIPPAAMKKVMHGDRISAVIRTDNDKTQAEPEVLLEPFLDRFIARITDVRGRLAVLPDHPLLKNAIRARTHKKLDEASLAEGDYVVCYLKRHPLRPDDNSFLCEVKELVAKSDDPHVPWWVILAKNNLAKVEPADPANWKLEDKSARVDLTAQPFVTIDAASTKDMDDALYIESRSDGGWNLTVAIADPTAYVTPGDAVDNEAKERALTQYLPSYNVPMLPRQLADELCSLMEGVNRPALCATIHIQENGEQAGTAEFFLATICSAGKLVYDDISDLLEEVEGAWQPPTEAIADQVHTLHAMANARTAWRHENALVFPDMPDYRFEVDELGNVLNIHLDYRRTANRIVEESMILANAAAGERLGSQMETGVFNSHAGIDPERVDLVVELLNSHGLDYDKETLLSLEGYCQLRRELDQQETGYLDARVRKMQCYAEMVNTPQPHFGMGLTGYATWTSPIRKYGDMINHRLLKAMLQGEPASQLPDQQLMEHLAEKRKMHRMCERGVGDWLYARYLEPEAGKGKIFEAEIMDINRGGVRVRLLENGAVAFMPAPFIFKDRKRLECNADTGIAKFDEKVLYKVADKISVILTEVDVPKRNVLVKPAKPVGVADAPKVAEIEQSA